jgi:uncharacterized membrane protein
LNPRSAGDVPHNPLFFQKKVWEKTHKMGGRLFKITGANAFLEIPFQSHASFFILVLVILVAAYTVIYSYFEYLEN